MGRELVIFLAEYLIKGYGTIDRITKLVNTTDIWLMPSLNPDGFAAAEEGHCYQVSGGGRGRANANQVDLNRNFPTWNDFKVCYPLVKSKYSLRNLMELLKERS